MQGISWTLFPGAFFVISQTKNWNPLEEIFVKTMKKVLRGQKIMMGLFELYPINAFYERANNKILGTLQIHRAFHRCSDTVLKKVML